MGQLIIPTDGYIADRFGRFGFVPSITWDKFRHAITRPAPRFRYPDLPPFDTDYAQEYKLDHAIWVWERR